MRIIISANGSSPSWDNYLGVPRHLVCVEGEILLHRTVRQSLQETSDVWVVGPPDSRYKIPRAHLLVPEPSMDMRGGDCFYQSRDIWNREGRTVILFGDTWYSDEAMATILRDDRREYHYFCRYGPSDLTGTPYGEGFAVSFYPEHIPMYLQTLQEVVQMYYEGKIHRVLAWEHYRHIHGQDVWVHEMTDHWTEINDWTEDFDSPDEYERWVARRAAI